MEDWYCIECGESGSFSALRKPLDLGVDSCPQCSEEVQEPEAASRKLITELDVIFKAGGWRSDKKTSQRVALINSILSDILTRGQKNE